MRRIICLTLVFIFGFSSASNAYIQGTCLNKSGKLSDCKINNNNGVLEIRYDNKSQAEMNKDISGNKITKLTGGEYARRRVLESVALGVLLTPLALFGLFSKKQRDTFGIEYKTEKDTPDATMIAVKKKYGMSLKSMLQSISGVVVEYDEKAAKKKKKDS